MYVYYLASSFFFFLVLPSCFQTRETISRKQREPLDVSNIYIYIYISFARTAICSESSFTTDDISIFEEIEEVVRDDDTATNRDNNSVLACTLQHPLVRYVSSNVLSVCAYLNLPTRIWFLFKSVERTSLYGTSNVPLFRGSSKDARVTAYRGESASCMSS